ncbi:hypothetical protein [Dyadobacter psychrophilus]|uniref:Uncharacterized protein n=1 Tax=Dyadobacter psychrophilus TaxID=651661 RepID=A0A1T5B711_9BACT|nr:hypothetical protein [Dyadobacter psychrophilus]SKB43054.1 hypothetical protein SAMN05660293_00066 [Dyadobacter psychrophilus]
MASINVLLMDRGYLYVGLYPITTADRLANSNYANYQQLVKAEKMRFSNGESSLFLINSRENKALEARQKLIDLKAKYFQNCLRPSMKCRIAD